MAIEYNKDQQITIRISKGNMDLLPRLRSLAEQSGVNVNKYAEKLLTFAVKSYESKSKKKQPDGKPEVQDFIHQLLDSFYNEFEKSRGFKFLYPHSAKDRSAMGKLLGMYKKKNPGANSQQTLQAITWFFKMAMEINEQWIRDNMSPGVLLMKVNYIQTLIINGRKNSKENGGTTTQQLRDISDTVYPESRE